MKLNKLTLGVLTLGLVGVFSLQQVGKPITVSAATSLTQVVRNTLVTAVRDPFYPDYYHRVFVFPTAFAGWWFGNDYASNLHLITFTSLDPKLNEMSRSFYTLGYSGGARGLELPIMNGTVPDSTYMYYPGSLTASDDFHFFFPASPSGELISPVRVQMEDILDRVVYVPTRWWEPMR